LEKRNIIVIGASAGGFEAIRQLVAALPATLDAAIFIVWHMAPEVTGLLPQVLNQQHTLLASNAIDNEQIKLTIFMWRRPISTCCWKKASCG
jgi:two-component system chemotaxis response regulator CheB